MKKDFIIESNIPFIQYNSVENCLLDSTLDSKQFLKSYKKERNKFNGEFAFIFKVKGKKNFFIVVNCFSSSFLIESIGIFVDFDSENHFLFELIGRSSYNLKKALKVFEKYENRINLTKRQFNYLFRLFIKSYKKLKQIFNYDYAHVRKHLHDLQSDKAVQWYYYYLGE